MTKHLYGLAATVTLLAASPLDAQDAPASTVIENVTVLPMDRERSLPNHSVVVRGRRIVALGPSAQTTAPEGAVRIDGRGKFLMPGLAEMHGHFLGAQAVQQLGEAFADRFLFLNVACGITTVRGMLGGPRDLRVREELARGARVGPQVLVAGPSLNGNSVPTLEAAWRVVTEQRAAGYDLLKIHPGIPLPAFDAAVETARREGIPFAGHIPADVGLVHALRAGIRSVEHLDGFVEALQKKGATLPANTGFFGFAVLETVDEARLPGLIQVAKAAGAWHTPTQVLVENLFSDTSPEELAQRPELRYVTPQMRQQWDKAVRDNRTQPGYAPEKARRFVALRRRLIQALHASGTGLLLGADAPQIYNVPGFATLRELEALVAAGLRPYDALVAGTRNPAAAVGRPEAFGTVAIGRRADLLLLDADPLADIKNVWRRAGVMVAGRYFASAEIEERLKGFAAETP
jgi:imidazolonepropionase-like amidohydrolase